MRTTLEMSRIAYGLLIGTGIQNAVSGGVFHNSRPSKSTREDVVVNSIVLTPGDISLGVGNINIHVPDVLHTIEGVGQLVPNNQRLQELSAYIVPVFVHHVGDKFVINIANQGIYEEPEFDSHYFNIRIDFTFFN